MHPSLFARFSLPIIFISLFARFSLPIIFIVGTASQAADLLPAADPYAPAGLRVEGQFARIEQEIARLRGAGLSADADRMASELSYFRGLSAGTTTSRLAGPRLDWIGVAEGPQGSESAPVDVMVRATGGPTTLALTSSDPVAWRLNVEPGAQIDRVIVYGAQGVSPPANVPANVPVELYSNASSQGLVNAYQKSFESYYPAVRALQARTGFTSFSLQGAYDPVGKSFSVGEGNSDWRAQHVLAEMRPLYEQALVFEKAEQRAQVGGYRFTGLLHTPLDGSGPQGFPTWPPFLIPRRTDIAEFTPLGPVRTTARLREHVEQLTQDPESGRYFGLAWRKVHEVDLATGQSVPLPDEPGSSSSTRGLTFDTKRNRLVAATVGTGGGLYTYGPDDQKWSLLRSIDIIDFQALTYVAAEDAFYGVNEGWHTSSQANLIRFDADGRETFRTPIATRLRIGGHWGNQVFPVGDNLGLLTNPLPDLDRPDLPPQTWFLVIDPQNGEVLYSGAIAIPEPGVVTLVAGCALLLVRRRRATCCVL